MQFILTKGSGKTFLYKLLLSNVRSQKKIALAVASSGIAALLLAGGRTAHSRFKIPIQLTDESVCSFSIQSDTARLLRDTELIIWDEAPMTDKKAFEALDRSLRDLMKRVDLAYESVPFGGKFVVFGGDFRQVLPVVIKGSRVNIVDACLNRSEQIWPHVKV